MKKTLLFRLMLGSSPVFAQTVIMPNQNTQSFGQSSSGQAMTSRDYAQKALEDAQKASERQGTNDPGDNTSNQAPPFSSVQPASPQMSGASAPPFAASAPPQPAPEPSRPPSEADLKEAERLLWLVDPTQSLRQSGGRLERPTNRGFFYNKSVSDQNLLYRWVLQLKNEGFAEEKIIFEAKRLSKPDFERWASRLLWAEQHTHPNFTDINY